MNVSAAEPTTLAGEKPPSINECEPNLYCLVNLDSGVRPSLKKPVTQRLRIVCSRPSDLFSGTTQSRRGQSRIWGQVFGVSIPLMARSILWNVDIQIGTAIVFYIPKNG